MKAKLQTFQLSGYEAILFDGQVEVSIPNIDDSSKILIQLSGALLDGKIRSLRINMPDKIVFVSAQDKYHLKFKAIESNNIKFFN